MSSSVLILLYIKEIVHTMSLSIHEIEYCPANFLPGLYDMSNVCKGCGKSEFIDDEQTGDRICISCGEVQLSNLLSEKPDWRSYKEDGMLISFFVMYR